MQRPRSNRLRNDCQQRSADMNGSTPHVLQAERIALAHRCNAGWSSTKMSYVPAAQRHLRAFLCPVTLSCQLDSRILSYQLLYYPVPSTRTLLITISPSRQAYIIVLYQHNCITATTVLNITDGRLHTLVQSHHRGLAHQQHVGVLRRIKARRAVLKVIALSPIPPGSG